MDATLPSLSLVIPAYNESAVIEAAVREADAALGRLFDCSEVIVVDDGSADDTPSLVAGLAVEFPCLRLVRHPVNQGYGAALRSGFEAAAFELVAFTDADCQFNLLDLGRMAPLAARYPIVAGFRTDRKDPWRRRFLSRGYNRLARTLLGTGVRDCDCALKVFRREALADLLPESRGFFVNTEMLARARRLGYEVAEVAVTHRPRLGGESKVSLREVPRTLRTLLGFWWREVARGARSVERRAVLTARVGVPPRAGFPTAATVRPRAAALPPSS
jgi:dolichol-phosphate mannosyltransferase